MLGKVDGSVGLSCPAKVSVAQGEPLVIQAFGTGSPPPAVSVFTGLPPGLRAVHGSGGLTISGTPRRSGLYFVTIVARNPAGTVRRTVTVHVRARLEPHLPVHRPPAGTPAAGERLTILPESVTAVAGRDLCQAIHVFGAPLARLTVQGPLPPGLHATGTIGTVLISGRVPRAGTYEVPFVAKGRGATVRRVVRITVTAPLSPPARQWA